MHELAITESILEIALRHAESANASRINHLYLVVGQLSSVVDDSVQFYWDLIAKDTIAAEAQLHFRRIPARLECSLCEMQYAPGDEALACPYCGSIQVKVVAGEEFYLEAIDVETGQPPAGDSPD